MKRILMALVGIAVIVGFAAAAFSAETKTTTKKETAGAEEKVTVETKKAGDVTATKVKDVAIPKVGDIKEEKVIIKTINVNDPKNDMDDTVVWVQGTEQIERKIGANCPMKANHLEKLKGKPVTITSTYNILDPKNPKVTDFIITNVKEGH